MSNLVSIGVTKKEYLRNRIKALYKSNDYKQMGMDYSFVIDSKTYCLCNETLYCILNDLPLSKYEEREPHPVVILYRFCSNFKKKFKKFFD